MFDHCLDVTDFNPLPSKAISSVPELANRTPFEGNFVFVVKNNVATVTPVKVARLLGTETVIESGLEDGDVVVTEGHLLLTNGARVTVRERKAGA
jgi:hypothetical protein